MQRAITAALVAVLVQGCFAARPAPAPPQKLPSAEHLLASLQKRRDHLSGLRTLARLRYQSPEGTENARNVLAVKRPDRIRFEVISLIGSMLVLTSEGGRFSAYVPRESTLYSGTASPYNLAPYLPIDVSVEEIVDLVLATPPMSAGEPSVVDWEEGTIRLTQRDGGGVKVACFADAETPVRYREVDPQGRTTIDARYEDIDTSGPVPLARKLIIHFPLTSELLDISMKDPEANPELPSTFFSFSPPADTKQVVLDGGPS